MSEVVCIGVLYHDDEAFILISMGIEPGESIIGHLLEVRISLVCCVEPCELVGACAEDCPHLGVIRKMGDYIGSLLV